MKQYNPSPRPPYRETVSALLFPDPVYMPPLTSKWPARPLSHSLYPGYKSGLRTLVQCCSPLSWPAVLRASPSHKLNFCLILPHVWKFFSNLRMDHNMLFCFCFVNKFIFIIFKIKIPHTSDVIWYLSLSDWLSIIISRCIHVAENDIISFLPYKLQLKRFLPSISLVNLRVNSSWISSW